MVYYYICVAIFTILSGVVFSSLRHRFSPRGVKYGAVILFLIILSLLNAEDKNYWRYYFDIPKEAIFETPEEAFYCSNPDKEIIHLFVEDDSAFIFYGGKNVVSYVSIERENGLWKAEPLEMNIIESNKIVESKEKGLNWKTIRNMNTNKCLQIIKPFVESDPHIEITDTASSKYERICYKPHAKPVIPIDMIKPCYYYAITDYAEDYALTVDGRIFTQ
ncbi:MAG: hypothetical protein ACOYJC_04635 [Christensenellales bacterium]|jgi:hypothetical protein